jgi:hypothetical protein
MRGGWGRPRGLRRRRRRFGALGFEAQAWGGGPAAAGRAGGLRGAPAPRATGAAVPASHLRHGGAHGHPQELLHVRRQRRAAREDDAHAAAQALLDLRGGAEGDRCRGWGCGGAEGVSIWV